MIAPATIDEVIKETNNLSWLEGYFIEHMNNGWSNLLRSIAIKHGVDDDLVEDMKQEIVLQFREKMAKSGSCDIQENPENYLIKIFTNRCSLHARNDAKRRGKNNYRLIPPYKGTGDRQRSPSVEAIYNEQTTILQRALDRIGFDDKQILMLHYYEGLKYREIGEILGIPRGTAQSRIYRAKELLKIMYKNEASRTRIRPSGFL